MAYKIVYSKDKKKRRNFRLPLMTAAFFLAFLLCVNAFWPAGSEFIRHFLLPEAVQTFLEELDNGGSFGEAVTVFCQEVLDGK